MAPCLGPTYRIWCTGHGEKGLWRLGVPQMHTATPQRCTLSAPRGPIGGRVRAELGGRWDEGRATAPLDHRARNTPKALPIAAPQVVHPEGRGGLLVVMPLRHGEGFGGGGGRLYYRVPRCATDYLRYI